MSEAPPTLPPAGWFPNPENQQQERWWTGQDWAEHIRPIPVLLPPPSSPSESRFAPAHGGQPFVDQSAARPSKGRRGFMDSPFERAGSPKNTPGTLSLVFALLPFAIGWLIPIFGALLGVASGIAAIVLGIVGIVRAGRIGGRRGTSIAGLIIGVLATIATAGALLGAIVAAATAYDAGAVESEIRASILSQTGEAISIECPENQAFEPGARFTCEALGNETGPMTVAVTVRDNQGSYEWSIE